MQLRSVLFVAVGTLLASCSNAEPHHGQHAMHSPAGTSSTTGGGLMEGKREDRTKGVSPLMSNSIKCGQANGTDRVDRPSGKALRARASDVGCRSTRRKLSDYTSSPVAGLSLRPINASLATPLVAPMAPLAAPRKVPGPSRTRISLHQLCRSNAVLARGRTGPVFGYGQPGDAVTVQLFRNNVLVKVARTKIGSDGRWLVSLGSLGSGTGYLIKAAVPRRQQHVTAYNVAVGELWLISGQSNLVWSLSQIEQTSAAPYKQQAMAALASAPNNPLLRLFQVPSAQGVTRLTYLRGGNWKNSTIKSAQSFSAVGYLTFANVAQQLQVPVGVVEVSHAGSSIVQWLPPEVLKGIKRPKVNRDDPKRNRFNGMIAPLQGAAWNGILWYQGEAEAGTSRVNPLFNYYQPLLEALLVSWRNEFTQPDLPWQIVQLPGYRSQYGFTKTGVRVLGHRWPYVREAERRVADSDKYTSLVTAIDLGVTSTVHPPNKFELAMRLASSILRTLRSRSYGYVGSGPALKATSISSSVAEVAFSSVYGGLIAALKLANSVQGIARQANSTSVDCFEVKFGDKWIPASARIQSTSSVTLQWSGNKGQKPASVRYAWSDFPVCNLYNSGKLPAVPFTTDDQYNIRLPTV